ncbi:PAN domain-containing protein [Terricaulis sp.]|uniref:PAN domain-containing protein n=1 Tax=Terricaulis sp. TaxID=2768686 RepID=UPI003783C5E2
MRLLLTAAVLLFSFEAAAQGMAGQFNTARPGAAYMSSPAADSDACARRCADDGLCMAWTFQANRACDLHANVAAPVQAAGAYSGLSQRAPAFAQALALAPPAVNLSETKADVVAADTFAAPPQVEEAPEVAGLLGGPDDGDLRPRS